MLSSNLINQSELYNKYKSSIVYGLFDFVKHSFIFYSVLYILSVYRTYNASLILIPLLSLLNARTFVIFHDCQHNSYTPNQTLNYIISVITGVFVTTSPNWILDHNTHHLSNGNIENKYKYFFNETVVFTVNQYNRFTEWEKYLYRIYKSPFVFFGIIPIMYFGIAQRFIYIVKKIRHPDPLKINNSLYNIVLNHAINNIGIIILFGYLHKYQILYHYLISLFFTYSMEFIIFHNQHSYNPSYVVGNETWNTTDSGIKGSSFIQIPWIFKYFLNGIEYHHIHHMNSKIPGYNLQKYHDDVVNTSTYFDDIVKLSLVDCYHNLDLMLYCEERKMYISIDELKTE